MPPVDIYTSAERALSLEVLIKDDFRGFVAKALSCTERTLGPRDISVRVNVPVMASKVADTELEITAHAYKERVVRQDAICASIVDYITRECPGAGRVLVLLELCEIGHSMSWG